MTSALGTRTVFRARHIAKVYRTGEVEVHALRDVDLEIQRGEFVVLLGPSGSGKSTPLNILGGLDVPSSGQVLFGEQDLSAAEAIAHQRRTRHHGDRHHPQRGHREHGRPRGVARRWALPQRVETNAHKLKPSELSW